MSLFCNFYIDDKDDIRPTRGESVHPRPMPCTQLAITLATAAVHLQELHVAFAIDAIEFLFAVYVYGMDFLPLENHRHMFSPDSDYSHDNVLKLVRRSIDKAPEYDWQPVLAVATHPIIWPNLRRLTLSSHEFKSGHGASKFIHMAADVFATCMPALECMEIVGVAHHDNRVFRFERPSAQANRFHHMPACITQYTMLNNDGTKPPAEPDRIDLVRVKAWADAVWKHRAQNPRSLYNDSPPMLRVRHVWLKPQEHVSVMSILKHLKHKEQLFAGHPSLAGVFENATWTDRGRPMDEDHEAFLAGRTAAPAGVSSTSMASDNANEDEDDSMIGEGGCRRVVEEEALFEDERCYCKVTWVDILAL